MIGIYEDKFVDYLKSRLGYDRVKVKSKSIICACPWCEPNEDKKHYHLFISTHAPIFHCFHADCLQSGYIKKLFEKLEGKDISDSYVDREKVKESQKKNKVKFQEVKKEKKEVRLPTLDEDKFKLKSMYIKKRLKYANVSLSSVKGLIFDVNEFLELNKSIIAIDETLFRMRDYLHANFVGFLTEGQTLATFRNIDEDSTFKFYKLHIDESLFLDYYKIRGQNYFSNDIVLSEGIFDILTEHIFDTTKLRATTKLYASGLSTSYDSMLKSIVYNEQIFRPNVHILSDRDIGLDYYKKLKFYNKHIIENLYVYYNKRGKDFGDSAAISERIII